MTHTHTVSTTKRLPCDGIILSICKCGARKRSDNEPIVGMQLDSNGWYIPIPEDPRHAYNLIQSEGYEETRDHDDPKDGINTNLPNID